MKRIIVGVVAIAFLSGCALTVTPQSGNFASAKPGMERSQVVETLGQPPQTFIVNGKPSFDSYACEQDGQIVMVNLSVGWLIAEYILTLGIAGLVDSARYYKLQERINKCDVQYGDDGKVSHTSSVHGPVVQSP